MTPLRASIIASLRLSVLAVSLFRHPTYAILGNAAVTFNGGKLSIKADSQPVSTSLVRTASNTGRLVWNGLHWVHIGGG